MKMLNPRFTRELSVQPQYSIRVRGEPSAFRMYSGLSAGSTSALTQS